MYYLTSKTLPQQECSFITPAHQYFYSALLHFETNTSLLSLIFFALADKYILPAFAPAFKSMVAVPASADLGL